MTVGTNLYTPRYSGESEDPRSLTLETTAAFVLHSRARHLLVHGRLCLPARLLFSYRFCPLSLRFFALVLLLFTAIQQDTSGCPFVGGPLSLSLLPSRVVSRIDTTLFLVIVSLARYSCSFFHRYRARIWFIARFVTISSNSRACAAGAHTATHGT